MSVRVTRLCGLISIVQPHIMKRKISRNNDMLIGTMTYMDFFVREVLQIYRVSGQNNTRQSNKATTVCGHQIDKGK